MPPLSLEVSRPTLHSFHLLRSREPLLHGLHTSSLVPSHFIFTSGHSGGHPFNGTIDNKRNYLGACFFQEHSLHVVVAYQSKLSYICSNVTFSESSIYISNLLYSLPVSFNYSIHESIVSVSMAIRSGLYTIILHCVNE